MIKTYLVCFKTPVSKDFTKINRQFIRMSLLAALG